MEEGTEDLGSPIYLIIHPSSEDTRRYYGLPKIYNKISSGLHVRPIVSSIGSIAYKMDKYFESVLQPLVGNTIHAIKNSEDFVEKSWSRQRYMYLPQETWCHICVRLV